MMVLGEIGKFEEVVDLMKKDIKKSVEKRGDVIFINLIDKKYSSIHVSLLQNEFINFKIFVLYKRDKKSVRVTLFDNNLVLDSRMYNLLSVAKKMNKDHSGGHMGGCGFTMPEGMTIEECTEKLSILIGELL